MFSKSLSFLLLLFALPIIADNNVSTLHYGYDAAGNRISRQLLQPRYLLGQNQQSTTFSVFPTVVTDIVNITTQDEIVPNKFSYTVTNVSGNIVLSGTIQSQNTQIQVLLPQGYYILNIHSATEQYSFNFLKN